MLTIIDDFIDSNMRGYGVGYFENDPLVLTCSQTIGKNQRRKYRKYGIVPAAFISYLKKKEVIQQDAWLPERQRTVYTLLDLLSDAPNNSPGIYSEGEALRDAFLVEMSPELQYDLDSPHHLWDLTGKAKRLLARGGTNKLPDYLEAS